MAGYWLSSFFACLWTETKPRFINSQKKEQGQYPVMLTEQAWSIKDLLYGFLGNFSLGTRREVLSRQDSSILPAQVASHARFDSSCPLAELAQLFFSRVYGPRRTRKKNETNIQSSLPNKLGQ